MFKGLLIVIVSFFTLPIRFIRQTFEVLAQIGVQGSVTPAGEERIPFLNWSLASGRVVLLLIGALQIVITPFLSGWQSRGFFGTSEFSFSSFLGGIVLGAIWAFLTIWWGAVSSGIAFPGHPASQQHAGHGQGAVRQRHTRKRCGIACSKWRRFGQRARTGRKALHSVNGVLRAPGCFVNERGGIMRCSGFCRLELISLALGLCVGCTSRSKVDSVIQGFFSEVNQSNFETAKV